MSQNNHLYAPKGNSPYSTTPVNVPSNSGNLLNQQNGGSLPPQSTQSSPPVSSQPSSPYQAPPDHLYTPSGPSPYTTAPIPPSQMPPPSPSNTFYPMPPIYTADNPPPNYVSANPPVKPSQPSPQPLTPAPSEAYSVFNKTDFVNPPPSGGIPKSQSFDWNNFTPQGQNTIRKNVLNEGVALAAPVAFVVAPEAAVTGAILGPVITQGLNFAPPIPILNPNPSGTWISGQEVAQSAMGGAVFSAVGSGVIGGLGLTAEKGLLPAATRVAVNTGLGGGAGTLYEYASTGKITGQGYIQGGAFGAAFGVAGEIGRAAPSLQNRFSQTSFGQKTGKLYGNLSDRVFGAKATEVVGALEISRQVTVGKETTVTKLTEPITQEVVLRGKELSYYRENNLGTLKNPLVDFAGTEKVYRPNSELGGKTLEPIPEFRQVESTRNAEPFISAMQNDVGYKMGAVKIGNVNDFLETPSDMPALQRTKVTIEQTKGQPTAVLAEKTVFTTQDAILPETQVSFRDFAGVKFRGEPDSQVFANPAKSLPTEMSQDIYKKLGGNYRPIVDFGSQSNKDLSGAMKIGSNNFFKDTSINPESPIINSGKETTKLIEPSTSSKEVTLQRSIFNVAPQKTVPMLRANFNGLTTNPFLKTRQQQQYSDETIFLNTPNSGLSHPQQPTSMVIPITKQTQTSKQQEISPMQLSGIQNIGLFDSTLPNKMSNTIMDVKQNSWQNIIPDIYQPQPQIQRPQPIPSFFDTGTKPLGSSPFTFPGSKFESGGFSPMNLKSIGFSKRIRYYPVADPLEVGNAFF